MELLLVRHGLAAERATWPGDDAARPLTPDGRAKVQGIVQGLDALGVKFDLVLHSPWQRAVETADLLEPVRRGAARSTPDLAVAPDRKVVEALLAELPGHDCVALVGHQPFLGDLLRSLLLGIRGAGRRRAAGGAEGAGRAGGSPGGSPALPVAWKKGGVAWLEATEPAAGGFALKAFLPPSVLRRLGRARD